MECKRILRIIFPIVNFFMMSGALSHILVSPTIINFFANALPRQDVVVTNQGDETAYLSIKPYLISNPGTKAEKKITVHDPLKLKFLVSPAQMIIPPHQHRLLRLMRLSAPSTYDSIYRIEVVPVPKKLLYPKQKAINKRSIGIRVMLAYGILAIVRPNHIKQNIQLTRSKKTLLISNKGNTNFYILGGQQCQHDQCIKIPPRRMYAGNRWKVKLSFDSPVVLKINDLGRIKNIRSN
jgi:P pilus assembly chaperone PapD